MTRLCGKKLDLRIKGASHAPRIDFWLTGLPKDFVADEAKLAAFMERRAPGRDGLSTARRESDKVHWTFPRHAGYILNENARPGDYGAGERQQAYDNKNGGGQQAYDNKNGGGQQAYDNKIGAERTVPRPGHADYPQYVRYGRIPTGGGANSGRMTAAYCAAGGLCLQFLEQRGVSVSAKVVKCGDIAKAKKAGDSVGGIIECEVRGVPVGLGGAMFDGLDGEISKAIFGIPGVKGIEFGKGFAACGLKGSENNDAFTIKNGAVYTRTNRHGGILGGFSSGMPIVFRVAMKPTPTIFQEQNSVDLATMQPAKIKMKGRHDPCIVRRAVPVAAAMTAFAIADAILADEAAHPRICLTLTGKTIAEDLAQYRSQKLFVDMVEVRADLLSEEEREEIPDLLYQISAPTIVTLRQKQDGGAFYEFPGDHVRPRFFRRLLLNYEPSADRPLYIDLEDDYRSQNFERFVANRGARIVRSHHDFTGKPDDLVALLRKMRADTNAIPKIAFMPKNLAEVAAAYAEVKDFHEFPFVLCIMGPMGLVSRACACRFGSAWTYASLGGLEDIGHVSPQELVRTYRIRSQTRDWHLYGVTGWPLKATRSPEINNRAWADEDNDKIMVPFPAETPQEAIAFCKAMGMRGLAVTIPHKQTIMPLLGGLAKDAKRVGAVNTVVFEPDAIVGENTDVLGFAAAIERFVGRYDFSGLSAAVLGAGGASKAVVCALKELGAKVKVFHRTTPKRPYDLIVNATPVDPIPNYRFTGREMVYDLVYVPEVTPLMARAKAAGCRVENGFSMLQAQAEEQRIVWALFSDK